jgi:hypothetical protein
MIELGKRGENLSLCVVFDITGWDKTYGTGRVQILHQRNGDAAPYPCVYELINRPDDPYLLVEWTITEADRAVAGIGRAELQYVVGNSIVKSDVYVTRSERGLGSAGAVPESPEVPWVEKVMQAAEAAENSARRAEDVLASLPSIPEGGEGGGTADHSMLYNRDAADQHPMSSITGLEEALSNMEQGGGTTAKIGEVKLLASAWTACEGSEHLYSQPVTIKGVTERSQVDLTPSVDQLVIFYEKDLTFVTENDGGEVTVYAIGQKPTNDYTIQVTITEVSV